MYMYNVVILTCLFIMYGCHSACCLVIIIIIYYLTFTYILMIIEIPACYKWLLKLHHFFQLLKVAKKILGHSLFVKLMKWTIYGQFVAGEDLKTLQPAMKELRRRGVRSILDYAVEDDVQNSEVYMEVRLARRERERERERET